MEDYLNIMKMDYNLNFFKWKTTSMENNLIYINFFFKKKMTSIYLRMKDDKKKVYIYIIYNYEDKET